jgi:putative oxidoreductase
MKKIFSSSPVWQNTGLALIRIIVGLFMIYHGWEIFDEEKMKDYLTWDQFKNPSAKTMIYAGKVSELIAGILLVLGLFTRIAAILVIGTLGYIAFFVGSGKVWADAQHPFLFVLLGLLFFFTGPGKYSFDHFLFNKKKI